MQSVNIIGAGLAGLSTAITLAEQNVPCRLISLQPSERAQSVLAEGGINASLNTMGEEDTTEYHFQDTMKGGVYLADPNAVDALTKGAPQILQWLEGLGVPFHKKNGVIMLRNFGGQKKKRTAYAKSSTGKILMTALIDEARKFESAGLIRRFPHHEFLRLLMNEGACAGVRVRDRYTGQIWDFSGKVLLCSGGMNGIFPHMTTGTTQNSGDVTATVFAQGVLLGNLEMLQYHPTTIGISGKRCLVTEAARGEGGRLYIMRDNQKGYFMEEKYPELGNLMPRDVVAREMYFVRRKYGGAVYLDMTGLSKETWEQKLSDLRDEIIQYLAIDPKTEPIPVKEGIHYFMGGIDTDEFHCTNIPNLYASGECTCQYHGANRLGGNSMLGALFGGRKSAQTILQDVQDVSDDFPPESLVKENEPYTEEASPILIESISQILLDGLGIVRSEEQLMQSITKLKSLSQERSYNLREQNRLKLAEAMLLSALERKESRGAHYREDFPEKDESFRKVTIACRKEEQISITFRNLPERRSSCKSP